MLKRYAVAAFLVVVVLGALAAVVNQRTRFSVRITVAQVETDIRAHLPLGSSKEEVESYLTRNQFPHSYTGKTPHAQCNCESALVPDTGHNWLIKTDIQVQFDFDEDGKLTRYSAREINTGP